MRSFNLISIFALVATAMATPSRPDRSVERCSDWSGTCASGSTYNTASDALKCQTDKNSDVACLIKCCVQIEKIPPPNTQAITPPKVQADPLPRKTRSVARCSDWSGTCAPGSTYNTASDALKCQTDKDSDVACVIKCCVQIEKISLPNTQATTPPKAQVATPPKVQTDSLPRKTRSVARCSDWSGTCAPGSTYNIASDALKCQTDKNSDVACLIKCCAQIEKIPPPNTQATTPPKVQADPLPRKTRSVARCSDWSGTCAPGSTYNTASDASKCQTDRDSDVACLIKCCVQIEKIPPPKAQATTPPKAQDATPPKFRRSVAKCPEWTGQCASGSTYNTASNGVECETNEDSDVSCLIKCCIKVEANTFNSVISCKEKNELDAGYKCSANEQLIDDRSCCRWVGECDTLLQCKQGTCCDPKEG